MLDEKVVDICKTHPQLLLIQEMPRKIHVGWECALVKNYHANVDWCIALWLLRAEFYHGEENNPLCSSRCWGIKVSGLISCRILCIDALL